MSFTAEFRGGPTPPHDRHFAVDLIPERLWFAKVDPRDPPGPATVDGWALVGLEPGPGAPEVPWDEQAEYRRAGDRDERGRVPFEYVEPS